MWVSYTDNQIANKTTTCPPVCGGGLLRRGNRMKYEVRVGIKEVLGFHFDNLGDAVDFVFTCVENGYRATVIPLEEGVENAI